MKKTIVAVAALAAAWLAPTAGLTDEDVPIVISPNMCTVTFNARGGSSTVDSKQVQRNSKVGSLPKASRTGCAFKGWYTKKSGGKKVTRKTKITKDVTFYARWQKKVYNVVLKVKGGGKVTASAKKTNYGKKVKIKAKPKNNKWVFFCWKAGNAKSANAFPDYAMTSRSDMTKIFKMPNGKVKYTAYFVKKTVDRKSFAIKFTTNALDAENGQESSIIAVSSKSYPTVRTSTLPAGVEFTPGTEKDYLYTLKISNPDLVPPGDHSIAVYAKNRSMKKEAYVVIVVRGKGIN